MITRPCGLRRAGNKQLTVVCSTADSYIDLAVGPINESATSFSVRISLVSGEDREPQFLFQRISVAIQRFNAVLLHDGFFLSCDQTTRISVALLQTLIFIIFSFLGNIPAEIK